MLNTNAVWVPSGYAQQARQFMPLIAKEGYETAIINFYGLQGGIINLDGIWQYPAMDSQWGDDAMIHHGKHFNADVIMTLQDIWTLQIPTLEKLAQDGRRWIPIVPIDHEPVVPAVYNRLKYAYRIISYSPFGHEELKRRGMHSTYIPHTVDKLVTYKHDKAECRKQLGLPQDYFMFGMVAANKDNPPRKGFQHTLDAFSEFVKKYPNSGIYFHTHADMQNGFPIKNYAKSLGILEKLYFVDTYDHMYGISPQDMAKVYSALDCYLSPSENEGFGVPIIEAQACEVPVLATNFTAMRDVLVNDKTGYHINVARKRYSPLQSYVAEVDTAHLLQLMERIYEMKESKRKRMGVAGREFIHENFELSKVFDNKWKPFLQTLESEIYIA